MAGGGGSRSPRPDQSVRRPTIPVLATRRQGDYSHLYSLCLFLIAAAFVLDHPGEIFRGLIRIQLSPSNLITDYMAIGGLGAAFFNSGFVGLLSVLLLRRHGVKINGAAIAAIITVCGFAFFGKTIFNSFPITLGTWLYARVNKRPFKDLILTSLYATALGPLVSTLSFGMGFSAWKGIMAGYLAGLLIGFIVAPLSEAFFSFHQGYNLYNTGFAAGIIGMVATGLLRMFDLQVNTVSILSSGNNLILSPAILSLCLILLLVGLRKNSWSFLNYHRLVKRSGRLRCDFVESCGYGVTLINMAIMGFISWSYIMIVGGQINGPSLGALFTIIGFSAYGKHLLNTVPIFMGAFVASILNMHDPSNTVDMIAVLFGSTLAPIAGSFGPLAGILAGFIHVSMVLNIGYLHGGMNLYNNGFSGAFVAAFLPPLLAMVQKSLAKRKTLSP